MSGFPLLSQEHSKMSECPSYFSIPSTFLQPYILNKVYTTAIINLYYIHVVKLLFYYLKSLGGNPFFTESILYLISIKTLIIHFYFIVVQSYRIFLYFCQRLISKSCLGPGNVSFWPLFTKPNVCKNPMLSTLLARAGWLGRQS